MKAAPISANTARTIPTDTPTVVARGVPVGVLLSRPVSLPASATSVVDEVSDMVADAVDDSVVVEVIVAPVLTTLVEVAGKLYPFTGTAQMETSSDFTTLDVGTYVKPSPADVSWSYVIVCPAVAVERHCEGKTGLVGCGT